MMRRYRRYTALLAILFLGAAAPGLVAPAAAAQESVIHVSASSGSDSGDGSTAKPYKTLAAALKAAGSGQVVELADGTYREGNIYVDKGVTIRAASGATPVLSGAEVPTSWSNRGDGTWSTGYDMVRFCDVCTTNANPAVEGMAAYPEQVFVDGKPLTQVASRGEVNASSFYVDDPDPVTLKKSGNSYAGFNSKPHRGTSYVIGVDPSQHTVEVVQQHRALTLHGANATLSGIVVEKYSPLQRWDYNDPEIGVFTGGGAVVVSKGGQTIENNTFRYSAAGSALNLASAPNAKVTGNRFENNGGAALNVNTSSGAVIEKNYWQGTNSAGFITTGCGAYCTIADTKVTHSENVRYAFNTVDNSASGKDASLPQNNESVQTAAIWFDEGVINSDIVGNHLINVPLGIIDEVSSRNTIASNIVNGAGTAIRVQGSDNSAVWNNTVSHALTSLVVREDNRSKGCNDRSADGTCTAVEAWSSKHGLSWDTKNTVVANNIFSSEQTQGASDDPWRYASMVNVDGDANRRAPGAVYANEMISSIDHNAYYRPQGGDYNFLHWWQYGTSSKNEAFYSQDLKTFTSNKGVTTGGKERHSLDLRGNPDANPLFTKEADGANWKASDFRLKSGSPASGAGEALPSAIAQKVGVDAGTAVNMGALVNAAWNGEQPAAAQAADANAAAAQAQAPSAAPTTGGAAAAQAQAPSAAPTTGGAAAAQAQAPSAAPAQAAAPAAKETPAAKAEAAASRAEIAQDVKPKARTLMVGGAFASLLASILGPFLRRWFLSMRA
ncbi:right-handed parallel beta-helix repeat-containing protein [Actinomyces gaoshouyii]|uniref:Peptidase n=1 Tax=Actinomyces gaoshouyii TaxID=1960083 RepID=A0A8H9HCF2_9ACTO|nr:right-handed parallel beta-helix repeat-containing protein [Actinomyces gaoshouyii]GGO99972.1 hypothetical protein GCM10011612_18510 [Actinomyces gaoshouyii]